MSRWFFSFLNTFNWYFSFDLHPFVWKKNNNKNNITGTESGAFASVKAGATAKRSLLPADFLWHSYLVCTKAWTHPYQAHFLLFRVISFGLTKSTRFDFVSFAVVFLWVLLGFTKFEQGGANFAASNRISHVQWTGMVTKNVFLKKNPKQNKFFFFYIRTVPGTVHFWPEIGEIKRNQSDITEMHSLSTDFVTVSWCSNQPSVQATEYGSLNTVATCFTRISTRFYGVGLARRSPLQMFFAEIDWKRGGRLNWKAKPAMASVKWGGTAPAAAADDDVAIHHHRSVRLKWLHCCLANFSSCYPHRTRFPKLHLFLPSFSSLHKRVSHGLWHFLLGAWAHFIFHFFAYFFNKIFCRAMPSLKRFSSVIWDVIRFRRLRSGTNL